MSTKSSFYNFFRVPNKQTKRFLGNVNNISDDDSADTGDSESEDKNIKAPPPSKPKKIMPTKRRSSKLTQRKNKGQSKTKADYMKSKRYIF